MRRLLFDAAESIAALVLVLACFLLFIGLLSLSFPRGTDLTQLVREREPDGTFSSRLRLDFGGNTPSREMLATLTRVFRDVKEKRPTSLVWESARRGVELGERHSVQSYSQSAATIQFDPQNLLRLGENSLVVIRRMQERVDTAHREATLLVLEGELTGAMVEGRDATFDLEVTTGKSSLHVSSEDDRPADFHVAVRPEGGSTYSVYRGNAAVVAGGRRIVVAPNHALTVDAAGRPGIPVRLPDAPALTAPEERATHAYRASPTPVGFAWQAVAGAERYRLVVARDPELLDTVLDEAVAEPRFEHGNLGAGTYYWAVRAAHGGAESPLGDVRSLEVLRDERPPELSVSVAGAGTLVLGRAEPGARVFIDGDEIRPGAAGDFRHELALDPGLHVVVVEAIDGAGNITYGSATVRVAAQDRTGQR